ncbi:hypothetical protein GS481_01840 [Rhodococcus hoagii]|nr:hypothetical protein [Prescottella equi]
MTAFAGAVGYSIGRVVAVPGPTAFWDIAAQPVATAFAGAGAITAGALAYLNGQRTRRLDAKHHAAEDARDRESSLRERYSEAARQLADPSPAIREAGVYAIAALADDWYRFGTLHDEHKLGKSEQRTCVNLLCSYLRANRLPDVATPLDRAIALSYPGTASKERDAAAQNYREAVGAEREEQSVRATILSVFRDRMDRWREEGVTSLDLGGANLRDGDLHGVDLSDSNLREADLSRADLCRANFRNSNLDGARMSQTRARATAFTYALMANVEANQADFTGASFRSADLVGGKFDGANFEEADLSDAQCCLTIFDENLTEHQRLSVTRHAHPEGHPAPCTPIGVLCEPQTGPDQ